MSELQFNPVMVPRSGKVGLEEGGAWYCSKLRPSLSEDLDMPMLWSWGIMKKRITRLRETYVNPGANWIPNLYNNISRCGSFAILQNSRTLLLALSKSQKNRYHGCPSLLRRQ